MTQKTFFMSADQIEDLVTMPGGCFATDHITVEGKRVGFMYREQPDNASDSGWRFVSGEESREYMDGAENHGVYALNTIANYDPEIIPLLSSPVGSSFARDPETGILEPEDAPDSVDDLHPEYPVVEGETRITKTWGLSLPFPMSRRVDDGSLILWRPGFTFFFSGWPTEGETSPRERLAELKQNVSADAFEEEEEEREGVLKFSYRLVEDEVNGLYGFALTSTDHLQVAAYFDIEADLEKARAVFASVAVWQESAG